MQMFPTVSGPLTCSQTSSMVSQLLLSGPCLYGGSGIRSAQSSDGPGRQEPGAEGLYAAFFYYYYFHHLELLLESQGGLESSIEAKSERKTRTKKSYRVRGRGLLSRGEWRDGEVACSSPA